MAEPASSSAALSRSKRRRPDDGDGDDDADESARPPAPKKVRFPKGKKVKVVEDVPAEKEVQDGGVPGGSVDPRLAATERAMKRRLINDGGGVLDDVSAAEINYENAGNFEDDGILMEPFNLKHEREEGYFDADGNFVEYIGENKTKDAWLDSVDADITYTAKITHPKDKEEEFKELSSKDIGQIKRRIANILGPGETVLQALRRLKGNNGGRKEKMSETAKRTFDQLTEDAMKLMENGDYNVYHEEKEIFEREAEGYEQLARLRENPILSHENGSRLMSSGEDNLVDGTAPGAGASIFGIPPPGPSSSNSYTGLVPSTANDDTYDMFADDDDNTEPNTGSSFQGTKSVDAKSEQLDSDYVYDESSGYYYSSSLGYYYDPASALYCSAVSGIWYAYNEQSGTYDEVKAENEIGTVSEIGTA